MGLTNINVDGMHSNGCAEHIKTQLGKEPGVRAAEVSFAEASAEVRYNPHTVSEARLREFIETGGFHVRERTA